MYTGDFNFHGMTITRSVIKYISTSLFQIRKLCFKKQKNG